MADHPAHVAHGTPAVGKRPSISGSILTSVISRAIVLYRNMFNALASRIHLFRCSMTFSVFCGRESRLDEGSRP
jgi:hypothetical protein